MRYLRTKLIDLLFAIDRWRYAEGRYYKISDMWTDKDGGGSVLDDLQHGMIFELIRGKFKGTLFCYKHLNLSQNGAIFDYHIVRGDLARINRREVAPVFRKILLNILWNLYNGDSRLQTGLRPGEEYNEDRINYTEEPYMQRTICAKGDSRTQK